VLLRRNRVWPQLWVGARGSIASSAGQQTKANSARLYGPVDTPGGIRYTRNRRSWHRKIGAEVHGRPAGAVGLKPSTSLERAKTHVQSRHLPHLR
jgi:hypothetical protein